MKVIVFDLGGTLMQYIGMPYSWVDFYHQGFESIIRKYNCNVSKETVEESLQLSDCRQSIKKDTKVFDL